MSNHAKPGARVGHNLGYWRNAEWLGVGAGAHSHVGGRRWKNVDDPAAYASRVRAASEAVEWTEHVDARTALFESLMMGLRLVDEGVDLAALAAPPRHRSARRTRRRDLAATWRPATFALDGTRLRCTPAGLDVLNHLLVEFV